ncbi:putative reverse transcriptase domain-containing protein [Tanacetum coccineum]
MPPRMTTRSAGRAITAPRGGRMGGRTGRGGGRIRGRCGDQGNSRIDGQGGQVGGQGSEVNYDVDGVPNFSTIIAQKLNQNGDAINDNIRGNVRNVIENNDRKGCTYKEFLACNPKKYDGKGGAIVYTYWIEKMEVLHGGTLKSTHEVKRLLYVFCPSKEMQKLETELWNYVMVRAGLAAYTDRFHELARLVPHLVTPENKKIERNGSLKKNSEKRGNRGDPSKDRNGRDDNNRTRTENSFATTTNPVRRENTGMTPKCTTCNFHHPPETPCRTCFNCNRPGHFAKDCRVVPRNVNPINARNPTAKTCYECGSTDHFKAACPRLNQAERPGGNHQNQVVVVNGGQGRVLGIRKS